MVQVACSQAMELLNVVFEAPLILNDGHEIHARLRAGDGVADIVEDLGEKFGNPGTVQEVRRVVESWDPLHMEALAGVVEWALSKLDTPDRILIRWKGDDTAEETVTRFELRDHALLIEFAHPPGTLQPIQAGTAHA